MKKALYPTLSSIQISVCLTCISLWLLNVASFAEETTDQLKIGMITILSGQYSDVGKGIADAGQLAVDDYNQTHPNASVKLILEDDGGDPKKAINAYHKLKDIEKVAIILPISTFAITSLRNVVNQSKRPTIIIGNEPYEPINDNIYMISPAPGPAYFAYGEYIATQVPSGVIGIVASQNEVFFRMAQAVQRGIGANRVKLIEISPGDTELTSIATTIKSQNIQAVVFTAFPVDMAKIVKGLLRMHAVPKKIFLDENIDNSIADIKAILGEDYKILQDAGHLQLSSELRRSFVKSYKNKYGIEPKSWSDYGYDAVALSLFLKDMPLANAREWLRTNTYDGVSGRIAFDDVGLRKPQFTIGKFNLE